MQALKNSQFSVPSIKNYRGKMIFLYNDQYISCFLFHLGIAMSKSEQSINLSSIVLSYCTFKCHSVSKNEQHVFVLIKRPFQIFHRIVVDNPSLNSLEMGYRSFYFFFAPFFLNRRFVCRL